MRDGSHIIAGDFFLNDFVRFKMQHGRFSLIQSVFSKIGKKATIIYSTQTRL